MRTTSKRKWLVGYVVAGGLAYLWYVNKRAGALAQAPLRVGASARLTADSEGYAEPGQDSYGIFPAGIGVNIISQAGNWFQVMMPGAAPTLPQPVWFDGGVLAAT